MKPGLRKYLIPFLAVDAVFVIALAGWILYIRPGAKPDIQLTLRHPESKLTEIDLINHGHAPGSLYLAVEASWPDADLVAATGLTQFSEIDTGRYSVRFYPDPSLQSTTLAPGQTWVVGWIKLTDDVPIQAQISNNVTTQP
jgi:hypothetical protein